MCLLTPTRSTHIYVHIYMCTQTYTNANTYTHTLTNYHNSQYNFGSISGNNRSDYKKYIFLSFKPLNLRHKFTTPFNSGL